MPLSIPSNIQEVFSGSQIPLTLTDPNSPDEPLILANEAFYRMTGYSVDEVIGNNCRFMQGKDTSRSAINTIRGNFAAQRDTKVLIRNYRKSGEEIDNYLYIFTLFDDQDRPVFRVGSQFEVPQFQRAKAFESHASALHEDVKLLNSSGTIARRHLIDTGELVGASVKSLLLSRLETLRSN